MNDGLTAAKDLPPVQQNKTLAGFLDRLGGRIAKGGTGVEVGTHRGQTAVTLIAQLAPAHVTLVDPWQNDPTFSARAFAKKAGDAELAEAEASVRAVFGQRPNVDILKAASGDALARMAETSLDWLHLDGCKYYPELLADLECAVALLRPGGVIIGAGLDWAPQLGYPVRAALEALSDRLSRRPVLIEDGEFFALTLPETAELAPRPTQERFLVVSTMKNEAPFILEWVAHYRALGFTDFLIYTNDCDDTTVPLLDRLTERGIVRHEPNAVLRRGPHKSALKYAQDHWLVAEADWVLICDVDEFLNLRRHDTIQSYLGSLPDDTDMVTFPWQVFGCDGVVEFRDAPVTRQFRRCEAAPRDGGSAMRDIKTIFRRPGEIDRFGLHRPRFTDNQASGFVWRTPDGTNISGEMNTTPKARMDWAGADGQAYMNHYPIRAMQSYLVKKLRGRANHINHDLGEDYFRRWNLNDDDDPSIARFDPAVQAAHAELVADPETARLHREGVAQMQDRIAWLMEEPAYRELFAKITGRVDPKRKPTKRDRVRRKMLAKLPRQGHGAEIGVWEGRFSHEILDVAEPQVLHLIDPWEYLPEFTNVPFGRKRNAKRMGSMYAQVRAAFASDPRVRVHRATSEEVLSGKADDSLDWVYIDGNPNEPFFSRDLELALRKVRPGGVIAGDDYYWNKDKGAPIKTAVDAFVAGLGKKGCSFELIGQQFLITLKSGD
ncbi:class I SAM-dependent methyltransferase [Salibaculum sp.]|uniref:class I SAM-dependent methyltransferase n=1 Tax=Salibaculum sp. TaxID=2855480 RepID=UPI002B499221|nr:class I SAM-dependent methyltransferase [Salibaculum sp.]HKL68369.1 class I SAM-dependent methyltransferase [Salibaculum sp.]